MKGKFHFTKKPLKRLDNLKQFSKKVTPVTSEDSIAEDNFVCDANKDDCDSGSELKWNEGRRIVELGILADGLKQCQKKTCSEHLRLEYTVGETVSGLGSWLSIQCVCGHINKIATGKLHRASPGIG